MRGHSCGNADVTNSRRGVECKLILSQEERERERFQSLLFSTSHGSFSFCERDGYIVFPKCDTFADPCRFDDARFILGNGNGLASTVSMAGGRGL